MKNRYPLIPSYICILIAVFIHTEYAVGGETVSSASVVSADIPSPLSLSDCITTALENNPSLRAGKNETNAAKAEREITESSRLPSLRLKGSGFTYIDDQRLTAARYNGEPGVFGQELIDIGLSLRMPLFTGGRIVNTIRVAELNESAFLERFARSRQELIFNVTSAFYTIMGRKYQMGSIDFSLNVLKKDRERIEALLEAKKAAPVDLLRLDVRLAKVEQSRVRIGNDIYIACRVLYNLMGIQTGCRETGTELSGALTPAPPMPDIHEAFETALKQPWRPRKLSEKLHRSGYVPF